MSRVDNEESGWEVCSVCGLAIPATNVKVFYVPDVAASEGNKPAYYCHDKTLCRQYLDLPPDNRNHND